MSKLPGLALLFSFFIVACGCQNTPYTGSPMIWSLDKTGYIRERDAILNDRYVTEADVVTLSLNTIYLKYIAEREWWSLSELSDKRQLLIYTEVFDTPESNEPFSTVIENSEIRGENIFSSATDRVIYGPLQFKGHPIRVKLYVIELDKEDNEVNANILKSIGDAASAAQPDKSAIINVGVKLGSVLQSFNKDDVELVADITFHPQVLDSKETLEPLSKHETVGVPKDDPRLKEYPQRVNAPVIPLRVGNYLLAKVESNKREKADDLSAEKEFLAASYFVYDESITKALVYKSGYLWLDSFNRKCESKPENPEKEVCKWDSFNTEPYEEKSYAIFAIHTGGKVADEQKVKDVTKEQAETISSLLQTNQSELIINGINELGQTAAGSLQAKATLNNVNEQAQKIPEFRDSVEFPKQLIGNLHGSAQVKPDKKQYSKAYNTKLLLMIRSAIPNFPLWPDTHSDNFTEIDKIKTQAQAENQICNWYPGLYFWNKEGSECPVEEKAENEAEQAVEPSGDV